MKNYYGMRNVREYASARFYDDAPKKIGSMACVEFYEDAFHIVKLNWGTSEDDERSKDGEVEMSWTVQGEALDCLKKICNNAKTPDAVVDFLKERFLPCGRNAHREVLKWLDEKQISYTYTEF